MTTHALLFMIQGLKYSLQAAVATYGSHRMTAERSFTPLLVVTSNMELAGFRVRCCLSDGASINRKVDKLLLEDYASDFVTQAAQNGSASEGRPINLVSDTRIGMGHTGGYHSSSRSVVSNLLLGGSKEFPLKTP